MQNLDNVSLNFILAHERRDPNYKPAGICMQTLYRQRFVQWNTAAKRTDKEMSWVHLGWIMGKLECIIIPPMSNGPLA